jgi:4'-phosphopantetheinyl transferase
VWRFEWAKSVGALDQPPCCLCGAERERAAKFIFEPDRRRYQAAHSFLRHVLAGYIECEPREVEFSVGSHGKPHLKCSKSLEFNLTHSGALVLVAVSAGIEVGVDTEMVTPQHVTPSLASYVLTDAELRTFEALPAARRAEAFFKVWCSKEAFLKGLGLGLSASLRAIDVSVDPDDLPRLIGLAGVPVTNWFLYSVAVADSHKCVLAAKSQAARISVRDWLEADFAREHLGTA